MSDIDLIASKIFQRRQRSDEPQTDILADLNFRLAAIASVSSG